ncbi:DNA polymerase alpha/epsilon subunit B [Trinorchestia longiramus]|nr:DNA polymerase alpha/epsilon subunit B [Trinorchestia longiramus]
MTVTTDDIIEEFQIFGVDIKSEQILSRCFDLCGRYELAADQLAASWLGFVASKSLGEMTLDLLDDFEREQLNKKKLSSGMKKTSRLNSSAVMSMFSTGLDDMLVHDDILVTYGASPVVAKMENGLPSLDAPATPVSKFNEKNNRAAPVTPHRRLTAAHKLHLSPSVAVPSERYSSRSNSGTVVATYVSPDLEAPDFTTKLWTANQDFTPKVELTSMESCNNKLMFEKLRECAALAEDSIMHMAEQLAPAFGGDDCWSSMDVPSNEPVNCVGRVCCDSVGKLNAASVLLEGSRELTGAAVLPLDLSELDSYALFPGQVIGVTGVNVSGKSLVVDRLVAGRVPSLPPHPITITQHGGPVEVVVACGPFTTSDNLLYEPLHDLLDTLVRTPPHVLILLGPMLDANHPLLDDGSVTETYEAVVNRAIGSVTNALVKCNTEIFIASSSRDVTSSWVYPTGPLSYPTTSPRLHLVSDPALLMVEGVVIAITTQDIVMDIAKEELAFPSQQGDRLQRLVHHILAQQSLFPVYPPPDHLSLSPSLLHAHACLNFKPHVLILPSDIRNFIKNVSDCVAVNPERLCKGKSGGCYARLELLPPVGDDPCEPCIVGAVIRV